MGGSSLGKMERRNQSSDQEEIVSDTSQTLRALGDGIKEIALKADMLANDLRQLKEIEAAILKGRFAQPDELEEFEDRLRPLEGRCRAGISALRHALESFGVPEEKLGDYDFEMFAPIVSRIELLLELTDPDSYKSFSVSRHERAH